uniref:Uncharacterized protein n=3 Tax=Ditylum brightwellii TaxID=49249 RepID=A0A6V2D2E4_9STRA
MPGGDHMNVIDPPGLTVMRIAGGRYRVTCAHRVVWTWMNQFLPEAMPSMGEPGNESKKSELPFEFGDLVTMTIVDVFETDKDGKFLSYCPTFDNRAIKKTTQATERLRKGSSAIKSSVTVAANSQAAARVNEAAGMLTRFGIKAAVSVRDSVKKRINEERQKAREAEEQHLTSPAGFPTAQETRKAAERAASPALANGATKIPVNGHRRGEYYFSDDDTNDGQ